MKIVVSALTLAAGMAAPAAPPQITDFKLVPHLTIVSDLGITNQIQYREGMDSSNWVAITNLFVTSSPYVFVDSNHPLADSGFYRVEALTNNPVIISNPPVGGMAIVPEGWFTRGDGNDNNQDGDAPPKQVFVSGFHMDTNLVSYTLWTNVYHWAINNGYSFSNAGSFFAAANHPVHTVSWHDAVKWCNARSEKENLTPCYYTNTTHASATVYRGGMLALATNHVDWSASGYRLPTEAEWEKAARGNTNVPVRRFPWGQLISQANACYSSPQVSYLYDLGPYNTIRSSTAAVGSFAPNDYGLYDLAGNLNEWCWDWYSVNYYGSNSSTNSPRGPVSGSYRVMRGGSWTAYANRLRCAHRQSYFPHLSRNFIGFRCVRNAAGQ